VSIHLLRREFGDAFVHVGGGWGVGIDGCTVSGVRVEGNRLAVEVRDIVNAPRTIVMKFSGVEKQELDLVVNGASIGRYTRDELIGGVDVDL
jgi:hypothetical protein